MIEISDILPLVASKDADFLRLYCQYLDLGWKHYSSEKYSPLIKAEKINLLEKAIYKDYPHSQSIIHKLQKMFIKENISLCLLSDVLLAWRYLASNKIPTTENQVSDVISYSISPLARMLMVLNDENPSTYLPMSSLLMFFSYLQLFEQKSPFLRKVKISRRQKESKLSGLLKSAYVILSIVHSKKLKFNLAIAINKGRILFNRFKNNEQLKIGFLDYIRIFLYSTIQFVVVRRKTITKKGI